MARALRDSRWATPAQAASEALRRQLAWSQHGGSALGLLVGRAARLPVWAHCPRHDALARDGRWQFYYHAHPDARVQGEHGHFHIFRRDGLGHLMHLVALSLDARGNPLAWFTTNLWVTGGHWGRRDRLQRDLPTLDLTLHGGRLRGVAAWLTGLVHAYALPLQALLDARDTALDVHARRLGVSLRTARADRTVSILSRHPMRWPAEAAAVAPHPHLPTP